MTLEENKALVKQFINSFYMKDPDEFDMLCVPEWILHVKGFRQGDWGPWWAKDLLSGLRLVYPDETFSIQDLFAEGDKVAVRYTWQGFHRPRPYRPYMADGKQTRFCLQIDRISNGKIVETWDNMDLPIYTGI